MGRWLVAGPNFGGGSSREQAPWILREAGVDVIIAPSFADIFRKNGGNVGILVITLPEADVRRLLDLATGAPEQEVTVDLERQSISADSTRIHFEVEPFLKERLLNGWDEIGLTMLKMDAIREFETGRPAWMPTVR